MPPWGKVIDPEGDCKLTFEGGKLDCYIPGNDHALSSEVHRTTAPRVLQEVTGDFSVQVKVSGDYPTKVTSAVSEFAPWQGAGLLVWWDMAQLRPLRARPTHGPGPIARLRGL